MNELKQVNISLTTEDYEKLTTLMLEVKELNRSAFIRSLIERAWAEHEGRA